MASIANKNINVNKLREVIAFRGMKVCDLAIAAFGEPSKINDPKHIQCVYAALRRDMSKGTMSDGRLDKVCRVLDCSDRFIRGEFPDEEYDPVRWKYAGTLAINIDVIICRGCIYWGNHSSSTVNPNVHRCKYWHIGTEWYDYCSRAEREE